MVPFVVGSESNHMLNVLPPLRRAKAELHPQQYVAAFVREQKPNICIIVHMETCKTTGKFVYKDQEGALTMRSFDEVG